ncbi:MAG: DUF5655 domain-containing protein [Candidatus Ventricola sp.]
MDVIAQTDAFFAGKPLQWALFEALRGRVLARWPDTRLRVMKTCVAFDDPRPYLYVSFPPRKRMEGLWLSISLREAAEHPRFAMVVPVSRTRYTAHIHLPDAQAIDEELLSLIALSRR